jgi:hypothetical protein
MDLLLVLPNQTNLVVSRETPTRMTPPAASISELSLIISAHKINRLSSTKTRISISCVRCFFFAGRNGYTYTIKSTTSTASNTTLSVQDWEDSGSWLLLSRQRMRPYRHRAVLRRKGHQQAIDGW